ncbi:transposase [Micromonospora sp. KC606]|uniref:IS701 family transposase n=1 Tax=Micromonospora sp. KC606 TaxID=2530379 RepID=UPI00140452F8|nr:transposase [Micromonospora sp. KC606]
MEQLCDELFSSLRRRDQRDKAHSYVTGLLNTSGRKSVRNIAQMFDVPGMEQSLHHFINDSSWDWMPVRRALAEHALANRPVRAWVVEPMVVPKTGEHSVGVAPSFFTDGGRTQNVQLSFGIWAASERGSIPVGWWLHVPQEWLADDERRSRAVIPAALRPTTIEGGVVEAFRNILPQGVDAGIPFVLDARRLDALAVVRRLALTGTRFLLRVGPATPLVVRDPALVGRVGTVLPAEQITWASQSMRCPVPWYDPWEDDTVHTSLVARVSVQLPTSPLRPPVHGRDMTRASDLGLLCLRAGRADGAFHAWLTNLTADRLPGTLYAASLVQRVRLEESEIAGRVGIRDYAGRTFTGWHRHATLASVAHAVVSKRLHRGRKLQMAS